MLLSFIGRYGDRCGGGEEKPEIFPDLFFLRPDNGVRFDESKNRNGTCEFLTIVLGGFKLFYQLNGNFKVAWTGAMVRFVVGNVSTD